LEGYSWAHKRAIEDLQADFTAVSTRCELFKQRLDAGDDVFAYLARQIADLSAQLATRAAPQVSEGSNSRIIEAEGCLHICPPKQFPYFSDEEYDDGTVARELETLRKRWSNDFWFGHWMQLDQESRELIERHWRSNGMRRSSVEIAPLSTASSWAPRWH
jgi:hypothetical protein